MQESRLNPLPHSSGSSSGLWSLTLRHRIALFFGALLLVMSAALLLFLNLTTRFVLLGETSTAITDFALPAATVAAGQPTPTPIALPTDSMTVAPGSATVLLPEHALNQLALLSVIGFSLVVGIGGLGVYWLSDRALQPVRAISRHASAVSTGTLGQRLSASDASSVAELVELTDAFNRMLERLERGFERERRFVSDAAHELQTPLATLRLNVEIAREDPGTTLEVYQELTLLLDRQLQRLEQLVSDLLLLTTGKQTRVFSDVVLLPLLEQVLDDLAPLAAEHEVELRLTGKSGRTVAGNSVLLERLFANLIENGIYYSQTNGQVRVRLTDAEKLVTIEVTDTGLGISSEEQAYIFERFYRSDRARAHRKDGSGLGLALTAHIVQQHGGTIHVESTPTVGSTFVVTLPTSPLPHAASTAL